MEGVQILKLNLPEKENIANAMNSFIINTNNIKFKNNFSSSNGHFLLDEEKIKTREEKFIDLVAKIVCLKKGISFNDYNIFFRCSIKANNDNLDFDCNYGANIGDSVLLKSKDDTIIKKFPDLSCCIFYNYFYEILYISAEVDDKNNIEKIIFIIPDNMEILITKYYGFIYLPRVNLSISAKAIEESIIKKNLGLTSIQFHKKIDGDIILDLPNLNHIEQDEKEIFGFLDNIKNNEDINNLIECEKEKTLSCSNDNELINIIINNGYSYESFVNNILPNGNVDTSYEVEYDNAIKDILKDIVDLMIVKKVNVLKIEK